MHNRAACKARLLLQHSCHGLPDVQHMCRLHADSPAALKLVAGVVQKLKQAAQLQPVPALHEMCSCQACHCLSAFLEQPEQDAEVALHSKERAQHAIE